jgi:protease-4
VAKKRDVIAGVIIGLFFFVALIFFGIVIVGMFSAGGDIEFAGVGGDIGIVEVFGVLTDGMGREIINDLEHWEKSRSIKAVVIHINSPGGGVAISQEILGAIQRVAEKKPVVASMASVAASGGYYIACGADRIVANPGSLTGSIGVIINYHTFEGLFEKIGMGTETIKSGDMKEAGTYSRPLTEEEDLMFRSVVMDAYEQFVEAVAAGRGMEKEEVYPVADGSVFTGLQAYNLGLVDTLGGLNEAVTIAADLAKVEGKPDLVRPYRRKKVTFWDFLGGFLGSLPVQMPNGATGPELQYIYR